MGAIVLFDGVCNFCNGSVNFIIERERAGYFSFAPLQSEIGKELSAKYGLDKTETDSVVVIEDGHAYIHSEAAMRIARRLDGIWSLAYALRIIPRPVRDWAYKLFAKYRYKLFGRRDHCMVPTPKVRARFL